MDDLVRRAVDSTFRDYHVVLCVTPPDYGDCAMAEDPNSPLVVAEDLSEPEAMALVAHLRGLGFDAKPWGTNVAALCLPFTGGFSAQVVVKQSEAQQARNAVDEFQRSRKALQHVVVEGDY